MKTEIKDMTAAEAWSAIYEHNLKVEKKIDSIELITKENQDQLKILTNDSKKFSEDIIRLDERQKLYKQEFDNHKNNQMKRDTDWDSKIVEIAKKTVETESVLMQNKILKWLVYHTIFIVGWIALGVIGIIGYLINKGVIK